MEVVEIPSYPTSFKVHCMMCTELRKFVDRITKIFPDIEAARPRCSSGIKALCSLNGAIYRAKLLLQYCSESSKLYLAIRTDAIVSRCRKTKNLLEQCLCHIQSMVPVKLVDEISQIVDDLQAANFFPDKFEEEAGKVVRELLQRGAAASDSMEYAEMKALQTAASRLHITSLKAISIEKESIKKLLEKISEGDQQKKILKYLLYLLRKYANLIIGVQTDNTSDRNGGVFAAHTRSTDVKSHSEYKQYDARAESLNRATIPPKEFKCPLSSRLMYDPVVIASGQTFERTWIQKWFDDGNETCPKTEMKLDHLSSTPNASLKDLITEWRGKYGIPIQDPSMQPEVLPSLENSSTSISSLGSSINDLRFPLDISNISLGSLDTSYTSDGSRNRIEDGSSLMPEKTSDDLRLYRSLTQTAETNLECLSGLAELDRESQYKMIEDIKNHLKCDDLDCLHFSSKNFIEPLIRFLSSANDLHDIRAQRAGFQLLSTFLSKNRNGTRYLSEDAYSMLSSFINSEVTQEVLDIMLVSSEHSSCGSKIYASGALVSMLNILDSNMKDFREQILKILRNLSSSSTDICSDLVSSECIPKLVPYLQDTTLARHCIVVLRNFCSIQEARTWITRTSGCIASIATLLETGDHESQEHALAIFLTLCSQSIGYCHLVMDECSIFPLLFFISANGSEKGKASAMELLRQLRDTKHDNGDDEHKCSNSNNIESEECSNSNNIKSEDANDYSKDKVSRKTFFGVKLPKFSRTSAPEKKK
ncbi:U-box domain-containing protein 5-like [Hibiscus syriacus]|uniref:U-box domain-containing protein 5-like n=1 Tax=Hibiscus syriacus TaxID=106335 RepID=UPI00192476EB|nr:U-box domain-containing protein 5-like [Hibiscus syriacus]